VTYYGPDREEQDVVIPAADHTPDHAPELDDSEETESDGERSPSFLRWLLELILMVAVAFVLATGIRTFIVQPYVVPTGSMVPTIEIGDRVIANKFVYRFEAPKPGDIIVLDDPTGEVPTLIKRLIAVGGQTIDIDGDTLMIDGELVTEPYTHGLPTIPADVPMPFQVPEGQVWVMGDNRTNSKDSRVFGAVDIDDVRGQAFFRFWPMDRIGSL
jgi:signal peptidase I